MQLSNFPPDQAIPLETPLNRELKFGGDYKQVMHEGVTRKWQLPFVQKAERLGRHILHALESQSSFLWTQPAPHEKEGQHTRLAQVCSARR